MRQAITVKYLPCTNYKPGRYKAYCAAGSITKSMCNSMDNQSRDALNVARMLAEKLDWKGEWIGGVDKRGDWVFTCYIPEFESDNVFIVR